MSAPKHTPGPWAIHSQGAGFEVESGHGEIVAQAQQARAMSDKIREAFDAWIASVDKRRDANGWEPLTARDVNMLREGYMGAAFAQQPAPVAQEQVACGHKACESLGRPHPFCSFVRRLESTPPAAEQPDHVEVALNMVEQPDTVKVPRGVLRELTDKAITEWHDPSEHEAAQDRNECLCCGVEDGHNADCAVAIALRLLAGGAE